MAITAEHLSSWAKKPEARTMLPDLVRRLVLASGAKLRRLELPGGSAVDRPGVDGLVEAGPGNAWVPEGRSVWELSCEDGPGSKAQEDLAKRSRATNPEERARTTFVFVTPRRWGGKAKWKESAQAEGWKEVRAYDADDLVQWLDATPAVALWFGKQLGILGPGVESPERFFEQWASACEPAITPGALATGRLRAALALRRQLAKPARGPLTLRADSEEEAVAFAAALLARSKSLAARTLVVTSAEGWRFVEGNSTIRIALCASSEVARQAPAREGPVVLVPHAAGDPLVDPGQASGGPSREIIVPRPTESAMKRALGRLGIDDARAEQLAGRCGRCWSIFRRLNARNPAIRRPPWLDRPESRTLTLLVLLEAFTDKEGDREVVAEIAGRPWEEIERDLRRLAAVDDAPVVEIGPRFGEARTFKAKSALELLHLWGDRITSGELDRFFHEAARLLAETDPALELPPDDRWRADIYGKTRRCSDILLRAIAGALPRLAIRGPETGLRRFDIETRIGVLVRDLLRDADSARWLSLSSFLPELAEAAPDVFLDALERALQRPDPPIAALFTESGDSQTGRRYFVRLLWALETLAWSRAHVGRVAEALAHLSANPRLANIVNSAAGSLAKIFCPWLPQTEASLDDRLAILEALERHYPDLVFDLRLGMLPKQYASLLPSRRPQWREDGLREHQVTEEEYRRAVDAAADDLLAAAGGNPRRLVRLIHELDALDEQRVEKVLVLLEHFGSSHAGDEEREDLCQEIRAYIRSRTRKAQSDEGQSLFVRLKDLMAGLQPKDIVIRSRWLFSRSAELHEDTEKRRIEAVRAVHEAQGEAGLRRLAAEVEVPLLVTRAAGQAGLPTDGLPQPRPVAETPDDIRKLLATNQPARALESLFAQGDQCAPELLLEALEKLLEVTSGVEDILLATSILDAIERLEKASGIDRRRLARVEFALFPILDAHGVEALADALFEVVTSDRETFVDLLKAVFRAEGEPARELDERSKAFAERAWDVLDSCSRIPGRRPDGTIDAEALTAFVDRARELAREAGRLKVCDQHLGQILAHAPEDPDGVWPCRAVAALLDRPGFDEVRLGFRTGIYNSRGAVWRGHDEGGEQERALAEKYRKRADRLAIDFPRVAATLRELAETYERQARWADEELRARLEGLR